MLYRLLGIVGGLAMLVWGVQGLMERQRVSMGAVLPELGQVVLADGLVDHTGAPFNRADLRGKVWIANFIFTSCPTACPQLTRIMVDLENRSRDRGEAIRFVSFTVDPETDSPKRMKRFGEQYGVNFGRWTLVTGPRAALEKTLKDSFYVGMGSEVKEQGMISIAHSEKFALVDRTGQLRSLQSVSSDAEIDTLLKLAHDLAEGSLAE